ncbi:CapA family protein, partial [Candidatus Shapirobacteria bacterium]|nr:CapA family protein [Candidatus Shapirobacteria bacterium]
KSSYDFGSNSDGVTSYFVYSLTPKQTDQNLTLLFGGDVMLGRSVNTQIRNFADYAWPTKLISEFTKQSDLFLINLESPFKSGCEPTDKGMVFCAHPNSVATLVSAGVDVVNIANNHIYNQGKEGLLETIDILNKNNIVFVGADPRVRPLDNPFSSIITIKNTKIAILGFNDIAPFPQEVNKLTVENLTSQIKGVRSQADLVIVTFHWGNEYQKASPRQKEYAHLAIDQGADAVIGAHSHWVQEFEEYQGKPVYYSLGNLVFDQMWSEETKSGLLVKLTYQNKKLIKTENFPVKIENYGQPYIIKL